MSERGFRTSDYDFHLPPGQIAQAPAERRDASRLLVVDRATGGLAHRVFADLAEYIPAGDALVVNETRVFPARLLGRRASGAEAEVLLLTPHGGDEKLWTALVRPGAKLKPGRTVEVSGELRVEIVESTPGGERIVRLVTDLPLAEALDRYGEVPLPPYVQHRATEEDRERYQTVYARERGSVAAPTAGLHFTPELMAALEAKGVRIVRLVLHVGVGTFRPVETDDPAEHRMHSEWYHVPREAADALNAVRAAGGAIWAVGTTVTRTLETVADEAGVIHAGEGWTDIFIRPLYRFRAVDHLITNFHLPKSTLMMLVAAFAGYELTMQAYAEAVERGYRFFSYGDAMVIV
ncbi:tRNA preQ1(34) S-adenosylmethionine ribosyltransferase-isomerase QueA [Longimicrobium sp.]|uniref:tRNA preQ1(34) S-adenosylmethionine ribosyltransferase-isomerase QueA n=1 Tax=Longimicrobium sp. TaxID=2029185 RepID=UPI002B9A5E25|nr:tRNA preQ1(34) S-adenosylmethionine ribosyltransferase-isomerase QueA [Longimicrobium sp.]HSU14437.1 tRNA preQ1(34) S-adenosylmethionine ribosyltransferase-isomerase QueA [Longimicrobium sp.]